MGYADAGYKNKIAPAKANLKVAMACDSVRMTVLNVVGNADISDSIGIHISYNNITNLPANKANDIFKYGKGFVKFVKGGQPYTCPVDSSKIKVVRTLSDSVKNIYVAIMSAHNLSVCVCRL